MGWERFYTAKSLEDTGKTVDEVEWSRRPDLTFYFLDAKGDMVQIDPEDGSFSPMWVPMSTCRFLLNSSRVANAKFKIGDKVIDKTRRYMGAAKIIDETDDEFVVKFDSGPRDMLDKEDAVAANSRACNGVRSRNAVVAKALNACGTARNADRLEKRFGNVNVLAYDDGRLGVRYVINLGGFDEFKNPVSWDDAGKKCAAEARSMASLFDKRASLLKQAATWLEQNAK